MSSSKPSSAKQAVKVSPSFTAKPTELKTIEQSERLLRDVELADLLNVSRRFIHTLRSRGVVRAIRLGKALRFPRNENLARVLADNGNNEGEAP